jgi:dienelactone hydrolase
MKSLTVISIITMLSILPAKAQDQMVKPIPWDLTELLKAPKIYPAPGFTEPGVKAIFYQGMPWQGKPTRVFAWYGVPDHKPGEKFPAMILVHGGGGTAFADWVRLWTSRGYAALAMDTCGNTPGGENNKHPRHPMGGPWGCGGFDQIDQPFVDQWPYHAVADVILANSLLRSFPQVDSDRIGLTGVSWGGYLTCIVAGLDNRFKFAAPVYGCGFLNEGSMWISTFDQMGSQKSSRWLGLWDPGVYLKETKIPMLWVAGTNDQAYFLNSLQKTYRLPKGNVTLSIRVRMPHAHIPGQTPEEIHTFADTFAKGGIPLASVSKITLQNGRAKSTFKSPVPIVKAELIFTKDNGPWVNRFWQSLAARVNTATKTIEADLPEGTTTYYFNVTDSRGLIVSTEHSEKF